MLLLILGSIGVGIVWGWLAGGLEGHVRRYLLTVVVVLVASLALGWLVFGYSSWHGTAFFSVAAVLAFLAHVAWRRMLRRQLL